MWYRSPLTREVLDRFSERFPRNYRAASSWDDKLRLDGQSDILEVLLDGRSLWDFIGGSGK